MYFPKLSVHTNFKYHETTKLSIALFPIALSKLTYILKRHYNSTKIYRKGLGSPIFTTLEQNLNFL